jgi:eukaryotic-like serine/threonine-protein kinase
VSGPVPTRRLVGRYVLLEDVTPGGMEGVTAAYDTLLERRVALWFRGPTDGPAAGPGDRLGEATAMARLSHPNVVAIHDVGLHDGELYLAMDLVDGISLDRWRAAGPRSARDIARVMSAAARGLAAVHAAGLRLGGVSPHTFLVAGPRVLVANFGSPGPTGAAALDVAVDVRGLCAVLYQLVHQHPPPAAGPDPAPRGRGLARLHRLALRGLAPDAGTPPLTLDMFAAELAADPAARRVKIAAGLAAAAAVAAAFWVGGYLTGNPERQCRASAEVIARSWNDGRRAQLRARYQAADLADAWPVLERLLDRYTGSWRDVYAGACSASFGARRSSSGQVFDLQRECLEARRAALDTFLGALAAATPQQLGRAPGAVLPEVADCGVAGRERTRPLPSDPGAPAQIAEIQRLLARSQTEQNLGDYEQSGQTATLAVAAARKLGYEPLLAAALVRLGTVRLETAGAGDSGQQPTGLDLAARQLEEAYLAAEAAHDDRLRLAAARQQVLLHTRRDDYPQAERWAALAQAVLTRLGTPAVDAAGLANAMGWMKRWEGKPAEATALFQRALEMARKIVPPDPRRLAVAQTSVCTSRDDLDERVSCLRTAVTTARQAYAPQDPVLWNISGFLAEALTAQDRTHTEGCDMYPAVIAAMARTLAATHPNAIAIRMKRGQCLYYEGRAAEARRIQDELLALDLVPSDRAGVLGNQGLLLLNYGDRVAAVKHLRLAIDSWLRNSGPDHRSTLLARAYLADALVRTGQTAEATRIADEVIAVAGKNQAADLIAPLIEIKGAALLRGRRFEPALRSYDEAAKAYQQLQGPEVTFPGVRHGRGIALEGLGRPADARRELELGYQTRAGRTEGDPEQRADLPLALGRSLLGKGGDPARGCRLLREATGLFRALPSTGAKLAEAQRLLSSPACGRH